MIIEITNQNSRDSPSYIMQIVPSNCVILLTADRSVKGADGTGGIQKMKRPGRSPRPLMAVRKEWTESGKGLGGVFFGSPKGWAV